MNNRPARCALVGMDDGSRLALQPLAAFPSFEIVDADPEKAADEKYWKTVFEDRKLSGLVVGTSDSEAGRRIEACARRVAARSALKIAAIEDYPGNYFAVPDAPTSVLIAESRFSERLYRERLGNACPPIAIYCSPRYDHYRVKSDELRRATQAAWRQSAAPKILWAGQPESDDCIESLRRIAAAVRAHDATLLIKAHPRDRAYCEGIYPNLLQDLGVRNKDVTGLSVDACLAMSPTLALTQFSSVAIEAGFFGIPSLHLVYHDVGGARLQRKKGYDIPFYCQAGAGFFLQHIGDEPETLRRSLLDETARASVITCFDDFFATRTRIAPKLADYLVEFMGLA